MSERLTHILHTKCILLPADVEDGCRISVMSRHTDNSGQKHDSRLDGQFDEHRPELGPSPTLIGPFYRDERPVEEKWESFAESYLDHLTGAEQRASMDELFLLLHSMNVTLMCIEETPEYCHRRLLAEEMQRIGHGVLIDVK